MTKILEILLKIRRKIAGYYLVSKREVTVYKRNVISLDSRMNVTKYNSEVHASASYFPSMKQRDMMKKEVDERDTDYDTVTPDSFPRTGNLLRVFHPHMLKEKYLHA